MTAVERAIASMSKLLSHARYRISQRAKRALGAATKAKKNKKRKREQGVVAKHDHVGFVHVVKKPVVKPVLKAACDYEKNPSGDMKDMEMDIRVIRLSAKVLLACMYRCVELLQDFGLAQGGVKYLKTVEIALSRHSSGKWASVLQTCHQKLKDSMYPLDFCKELGIPGISILSSCGVLMWTLSKVAKTYLAMALDVALFSKDSDSSARYICSDIFMFSKSSLQSTLSRYCIPVAVDLGIDACIGNVTGWLRDQAQLVKEHAEVTHNIVSVFGESAGVHIALTIHGYLGQPRPESIMDSLAGGCR
jgi:hypothetical protein